MLGKRERKARVETKPSPSLTPAEVVDAQFQSFSRDCMQGVEDAFQFVSPTIIEQYSMDAAKFKQILSGLQFEGILGCYSWNVTSTNEPSDDRIVMNLRVLPKPITGCVKSSGVAGQDGITWPSFYEWELVRASEGEYADCWMLEQLRPRRPPIDVASEDGTPRVAASSAA